jgi:hydrogenase-4 membrane subunit HyfE
MTTLFGVAALVASLALLTQRQAGGVTGAYAWQSAAVALAAAWEGIVLADWQPWIAALLILLVNGIALPRLLKRLVPRLDAPPSPALRLLPAMAAGIGLVALSASVMIDPSNGVPGQDLAMALAVVLLGLLAAISGTGVTALAGILSVTNGVLLAALNASVLDTLMLVPLTAGILALAGTAAFGAYHFRAQLDGTEPQ